MKWTVTVVRKEDLREMWPLVAPWLAPAIEYSGGRYDTRTVFRQLQDGPLMLWAVYGDDAKVHAAFVSREARYPLRRLLAIDFMGGERLEEWRGDVTDVLRRFAADCDLDGVEFYGRPGWGRPLKALGWRQNIVLHELDAPKAQQ